MTIDTRGIIGEKIFGKLRIDKVSKSSSKTVMILGANGMLGYAVEKYFLLKGYKTISLTRKEFDLIKDPIKKLKKYINKSDYIINCAGIIKPRIKDHTPEEAIHVNGIFPRNLAVLSKQLDTPCFHITTDCAYSGEKGNYKEDDPYDAKDLYGLSKAVGDTTLCMTLRTSTIGEEKDYSRSLVEWVKSQKDSKVNGYTNHKWNGVTTVYLAEIIENIIKKNLYKEGIFHIHSKNAVTKYKLLQLINKEYSLNIKITPFKAKEIVDRSLKSIYKLNQILVKKSIPEQIKEMKSFFEL